VFSDEVSNIKQSIRGGTILPRLALVDPELTVSCPASVTAASGLDALTQGIESYIARNANHTTQALAMQGVRLIDRAIETACADGTNKAARSDMSEGTMLGAMAFAVSGLGAVHGLAHPLGAKLHLPHGLVCGILLPQILKWNYPVCRDELNDLACFAGLPCAEALIARTEELLEKFGIERKLSAYGLTGYDLPWIVSNSRSGSMRANPRDFSDAELSELLREML
jgi:alcohol dehydrogenase class IV